MRAVIKDERGRGMTFTTSQPDHDLLPGDVRVEIAASSVCGTDLEVYEDGPAARDLGLTLPAVMGHEAAGTVIEVGSNVVGMRVGSRVALETHLHCGQCYLCRNGAAHNCPDMRLLGINVDGTFAERTVVPARNCFLLPDDMDLDTAALLEPAGSAMHAVIRAQLPIPGASALVAGAGPVGLLLTQILEALGARSVTVIEPNAERRGMAQARGAVAVAPDTDPVDEADSETRRRGGFDVAFDCSGAVPALAGLLAAVRREATVMTIGLTKQELPLAVTRHLIQQGLTLRGSFGRSIWETWDQLCALVVTGKVGLDALVTHRLPLEDLPVAFELMRDGAGKVLLLPSIKSARESNPLPRCPDRGLPPTGHDETGAPSGSNDRIQPSHADGAAD